MIADMFNNKNVNPVVTELFIKDRELNISLVFPHNHTLKCRRMLD